MLAASFATAQERPLPVGPTEWATGVEAASIAPRSLPELVRATERGELVLVLVALDVPLLPEGTLTAAARRRQRDVIGDAQASLLERLAPLDPNAAVRFRTIPYLALRADAAALRALMSDAGVTSIVEDVPVPPTLRESAALVGAPGAWDAGYSGTGQAVAVFDTGVALDHPFFAGRIVAEACFSGAAGTGFGTSLCPNGEPTQIGPGAGDDCDADDWNGCGHGTHVAGIAAGLAHVGQPMGPFSGVARGAGVIAVQVFSGVPGAEEGSIASFGTDRILAFEHVLDLLDTTDIAAVNMSLGGGNHGSVETCDASHPAEKAAVDNLRAYGVATIAASGNDGAKSSMGGPACISSVVSVGSTTKTDAVSDFSTSADFLDLLAPGSDIVSAVPGGAYAVYSGTSMASPHVAGAWAVLRQRHPAASVDDILAYLLATGEPIIDTRSGASNRVTPRINVERALDPSGIFATLSLTVGTEADECATTNSLVTTVGTNVHFCYRLYNAGIETAVSHRLEDVLTGVIASGALLPPIEPRGSRVYIVPYRVTGSVSNTATWSVTGDAGGHIVVERPGSVVTVDYASVPALPIDRPPDHVEVVEDSIFVTDAGVVQGIALYLDITHSFVGDLEVRLTHVESGTSIPIVGVAVEGFGWCWWGTDIRAFFRDGASINPYDVCTDQGGLAAGPYLPDAPLSTFAGVSLAGEWRLTVTDIFRYGSGGVLNGWGLDVLVAGDPTRCDIGWFADHPLGDYDADGTVGVTDALRILRTAVGDLTDPTAFQRYHADMDGDGYITVADALLALRKAVDPTRPAVLQLAPGHVTLAQGGSTCVLLGNSGNVPLPGPVSVTQDDGLGVQRITHAGAVGEVYMITLDSGAGGQVTFDAGPAGTRSLTVERE